MDKTDLKKAGLKITLPRVKILKILEESAQHHLSAEDVHKKLQGMDEEVGLPTVYRVLTQFETAGLVTRLRFDDERSIFELNRGGHHDHIVCVQCHRVEEFVDNAIEAKQQKIAEDMGYDMTDHTLYLYGEPKTDKQGVCLKCGKHLTI